MRAVGIKVFKNKLKDYVRSAAAGETILVTDHGKVVAELTPPRAARSPLLADARLADAIRRGYLTAPLRAPDPTPPPSRAAATLSDLVGELTTDRQDR